MDNEFITLYDVSNKTCKPTPEYHPISIKDIANKPMLNPLDCKSNAGIFLSDKNIHDMVQFITSLNDKKVQTHIRELRKLIPVRMVDWVRKNNINDYEGLYDDPLIMLRYLNEKFIKDNNDFYTAQHNSVNVLKTSSNVTDRCGNVVNKKYNEMLASDYHTIDIQQRQDTYTDNNQFRNNNQIPMWQKSMNVRHYDRSNDGLQSAEMERASLDNQIHGYDMSNIIKGSTYYKHPSYEDF